MCTGALTPDASAPDASAPDASAPDVGPPDTAPVDVATFDAPDDVMTLDAPADVATLDTALVDGSAPEAAAVDAVTSDAGACPAGQVRCAGACVDTATSSANCGACGRPCLAGTACLAGACGASTSAWRTFGSDAQHSGRNPDETGVPPLAHVWSISVFGGALSPVVVDGGRVFATPSGYFPRDAAVQALRVESGALLWSHAFTGPMSVGQPTVAADVVYVAQNHGTKSTSNFWALDAATGATRWVSRIDSQWEHFYAPLVVAGRVYTGGGEYGGMYAFDSRDGTQAFFQGLDQYDAWSPASFGGLVYSFQAGHLRAHDPVTGAVRTTVNVDWRWSGYTMNTAAVFGPSLAYLVAPPNLYAVNPTTRAIEWTATGGFAGTAAVADGVVYAIRAGALVARDATTGEALWTFAGDVALSYPPVVAAGRVYVSSASRVYAVNVATHAQEWAADGGGWLTVAAGRLFVARSNGWLEAYSFTR